MAQAEKSAREAEPRTGQDAPLPKSNKRQKGRPTTAQQEQAAAECQAFFQTLTKITRDEWGARYNVYVYRNEPITDRTRSGESKYIMQYAEPVDEDRLLADHGSGRYKLMLNFRKAGAERGEAVDIAYISLLNTNFPPKIPPGEWVDDNRNRQWAWAKKYFPAEQGNAAAAGQADPLKTLETFNKIRKDVVDEMRPTETPAGQMLTLATILEKLRPVSEDKLTPLLFNQYCEMTREFIKSKSEERPNSTNGLEMIKEVVKGFRELVPQVQQLIPGAAEGHAARSRLNSWQEFTVALAPHFSTVFSPLVNLLMARMGGPAGQPGAQFPAPALAPGQAPPANGAAPPVTMMPFLQMLANPMLNYIREMAPPDNADPQHVGEDFAAWVYEGFGASPHYTEAITAVRLMGAVGLTNAFRGTPWWNDRGPTGQAPSLATLEPQLFGFFNAFLNWKPQPPEDEEEDDVMELHTASEKAE